MNELAPNLTVLYCIRKTYAACHKNITSTVTRYIKTLLLATCFSHSPMDTLCYVLKSTIIHIYYTCTDLLADENVWSRLNHDRFSSSMVVFCMPSVYALSFDQKSARTSQTKHALMKGSLENRFSKSPMQEIVHESQDHHSMPLLFQIAAFCCSTLVPVYYAGKCGYH